MKYNVPVVIPTKRGSLWRNFCYETVGPRSPRGVLFFIKISGALQFGHVIKDISSTVTSFANSLQHTPSPQFGPWCV